MRYGCAIILLAVSLAGCSSSRDAVHARDNSAISQERKDWQMQIEQRLKKIDREMDDLVAKANTDANVTRMKDQNQYYERMAQLQKQRTDTRQKYEAARNASPKDWDQLRADADKAADSIDAAWQKFLQDLRS